MCKSVYFRPFRLQKKILQSSHLASDALLMVAHQVAPVLDVCFPSVPANHAHHNLSSIAQTHSIEIVNISCYNRPRSA